jgi:zinc protease
MMTAVLLLGGFLFVRAAGAQDLELTRDQPVFDSGRISAFAEANLPSFTVATLRNGIPVVIKRATANRILTLRVMLRGHVAFTPVEKAGLEAAMLTMMTRGSAHYTYADLQRALFESSARISPRYQSFDGTSLDLVTIDTYFDDLFPLFADSFLHPSWDAAEFRQVMRDFKLMKQRSENDPYAMTVQRLHDSFFAGHPYASSWEGAGQSLDAISLGDVKGYYERTVGSGRIFIVAVGDFDPPKLVAGLNATFGAMPRTAYVRPPVPSFTGRVKPDLLIVPFPQSEGLAYLRGDFAMPGPRDPDYAASLVAFDLLSDVLFEIVRTRNGAAYSASAGVHGVEASYGDITVFKSSVPGQLKPLIDQSIAVITSGRSLGGNVSVSAAGKSGIGTAQTGSAGSFVPIAEALPFYKTKYLAEFYSGQQTNISIAAQVAWSIIYNGDYRDYLLLMDRIQAVTADDVVRVAGRYLVGNPTVWAVLGDPALLSGVKRADFFGATGN